MAHTGLHLVARLLANRFEAWTTTVRARAIAGAASTAECGYQPSETGEVEEDCSVNGHAAADDTVL